MPIVLHMIIKYILHNFAYKNYIFYSWVQKVLADNNYYFFFMQT